MLRILSVILTCYNSSAFLRPALESILAQTFSDFELLAVDDGSHDDSLAILQDYAARDVRLKVTSHPNMGTSLSLNGVAALAQGEFLLICDADDVYLPDCFASQVAFMQANRDLVGAGPLARFMNERGELFWAETNPFITRDAYQRAMQAGQTLYFRHPGFIMRRAALDKAGGYRIVPQANDIDFFNRLADHGPILTNPQVLVHYRIRAGQETTAYNRVIDPRLTWAWIGACARARRAGQPEPDREQFVADFERQPWHKRLGFTLFALAQGYFYEAKVDFITRKPSFIWKLTLAALLGPFLMAQKLASRLTGRAVIQKA